MITPSSRTLPFRNTTHTINGLVSNKDHPDFYQVLSDGFE